MYIERLKKEVSDFRKYITMIDINPIVQIKTPDLEPDKKIVEIIKMLRSISKINFGFLSKLVLDLRIVLYVR